jgi:hypothetical protein
MPQIGIKNELQQGLVNNPHKTRVVKISLKIKCKNIAKSKA